MGEFKVKVTSREQILEKAMEITTQEGIDALSIRKLAASLNIAVGCMYNYYKNKEQLLDAVVNTFWEQILESQEVLYHDGIRFTDFLEQYYLFLYGRLSKYDRSWLREVDTNMQGSHGMSLQGFQQAKQLLYQALEKDQSINDRIWNMALNPDSFCEYVLTNLLALLRAGESNCRFFIYLIEHLLYCE